MPPTPPASRVSAQADAGLSEQLAAFSLDDDMTAAPLAAAPEFDPLLLARPMALVAGRAPPSSLTLTKLDQLVAELATPVLPAADRQNKLTSLQSCLAAQAGAILAHRGEARLERYLAPLMDQPNAGFSQCFAALKVSNHPNARDLFRVLLRVWSGRAASEASSVANPAQGELTHQAILMLESLKAADQQALLAEVFAPLRHGDKQSLLEAVDRLAAQPALGFKLLFDGLAVARQPDALGAFNLLFQTVIGHRQPNLLPGLMGDAIATIKDLPDAVQAPALHVALSPLRERIGDALATPDGRDAVRKWLGMVLQSPQLTAERLFKALDLPAQPDALAVFRALLPALLAHDPNAADFIVPALHTIGTLPPEIRLPAFRALAAVRPRMLKADEARTRMLIVMIGWLSPLQASHRDLFINGFQLMYETAASTDPGDRERLILALAFELTEREKTGGDLDATGIEHSWRLIGLLDKPETRLDLLEAVLEALQCLPASSRDAALTAIQLTVKLEPAQAGELHLLLQLAKQGRLNRAAPGAAVIVPPLPIPTVPKLSAGGETIPPTIPARAAGKLTLPARRS